jgi:uncharacterized membrane protein
MSLESGRKLGLTASWISIILPVVAVVGVVAIIFSIIATATTGTGTGTVVPNIFGLSIGLIGFVIALAFTAIVGFILFMVAMHRLSNYYNEPGIFRNVLYAFILSIVEGIVLVGVYIGIVLSAIGSSSITNNPPNVTNFMTEFVVTYLVAIGVGVVFAIVNGVLYMRAFNKLKEKSGVDNFGTAGILYLVGTIIPIVGWIAWIFVAMAFNKLKPSSAAPPTFSYPTQPPPTNMQTKRCPNCGAENHADALYCVSCSKPLQ